jgi:hypothetical protein
MAYVQKSGMEMDCDIRLHLICLFQSFIYLFLVVLGVELRALRLLGGHSTT